MSGHNNVEFHGRKTLKLYRTVLHRFEVEFAQELNLYIYKYILLILKPFRYQLMHIMLKNTELLKQKKITLQHVSVYAETIFRQLQSVLG